MPATIIAVGDSTAGEGKEWMKKEGTGKLLHVCTEDGWLSAQLPLAPRSSIRITLPIPAILRQLKRDRISPKTLAQRDL